MPDDPGHRRPAIFNEAAEDYDAVRPGYPEALFDDLVTLAGLPPDGHILEIGCGTGQATVPLARRGYRITAVEMGAQLAAVARRKLAAYPRAEVVVGRFEDEPLEAGAFDLAIAATSFHWLDPAVRYARVAQALRPGGALAPFRNVHVTIDRDGGVFEAAQEVYWRVVPAWARAFPGLPRPEEARDAEAEQLAAAGLFGPVVTRRYLWTAEYDAARYVRLLGTYSDYASLEPATRRALFDGLADLIDSRFGGRIVMGYLATLAVARRR
jgi:SAM-dependent methyltransferase